MRLTDAPIVTANDRAIPPTHPGTFLRIELLEPLGLSQHAVAKGTGIPVSRINQIVLGRRAVTAETDLRLCRFFGYSEGFFLRCQLSYDLRLAKAEFGKRIAREVKPLRSESTTI